MCEPGATVQLAEYLKVEPTAAAVADILSRSFAGEVRELARSECQRRLEGKP